MNHVYFTATLDAAAWGAELASGEGRGRIYLVEPTGPFEDDPNVTDKKFPGNPTQSFRSSAPLRVVGELADWVGHPGTQLQAMRDGIEALKRRGGGAHRRLTRLGRSADDSHGWAAPRGAHRRESGVVGALNRNECVAP